MGFQPLDFVLLAVLIVGGVWVLYGVIRRVLVFVCVLVALLAVMAGTGYFQTGHFGKGFFAERSMCVGIAGTFADAWVGLGAGGESAAEPAE